MKRIILLLILISLFIIPINALENKIVIDKLFNYDMFSKGWIIAQNDNVELEKRIENKVAAMNLLGGYNDNYEEAGLIIDYIDNNVDINKIGTYTIDIYLKLSPEYADDFILDDSVKKIRIPVRISDPNVFDVFITRMSQSGIEFSWLTRKSEYTTLNYIESDHKIDLDSLKNASWKIYEKDIFSTSYSFSIKKLQLNKHYYFRFTNSEEKSNIIHFYYDKGLPTYDSMGGDRDGGDAQSTPPPDIEQPAPEISKNQDYQVASSNNKNTFKINEYFGQNKDELSGQRILEMQQISKNDVKFSKHGILVTIPSSTIDMLNIQDNDIFNIEINKISDYRFKLDITLNGEKINQLKDMKIMVPYTSNNKKDSVIIIDPNNKKITGTYDSSLKVITFITDYPGTYEIQHKQINKAKKADNYIPLYIGIISITSIAVTILIKRGKNYVKKI